MKVHDGRHPQAEHTPKSDTLWSGVQDLIDVPVGLLRAALDGAEADALGQSTLRHEVKLITAQHHRYEVTSWLRLHADGFRCAHPTRQVNNVYFDSPTLDTYRANLAGVAQRHKVRLRWYGLQRAGVQGAMELKCKRDSNGWKIVHPLTEPKDLTRMSWPKIIRSMECELGGMMRALLRRFTCPTLLNCYRRQYFVSQDGHVRATIDDAAAAFDQRLSPKPNLNRGHPAPHAVVVEFKAAVEHRHQLAAAVSEFPFKVYKHSKYQSAVEAILNSMT